MRVRRIDTGSRRDVGRFIDLPFDLYEGSPYWVPPLVSGVRAALDRSEHPFYRHSTAAFFLAEEGDDTVGRIAVLNHRRYNDYHDKSAAFFHYFDVVDDVEVAEGLFDAASAWARTEGLDTVIGPKGFLRSDGMGILVDGFEYRAVAGIPYNFPYYRRLVEAVGFVKEIDYLSGFLPGDYDLPERFYRIAERVKERRGFWIKSFASKAELKSWIPEIQRVNNEAFTEVWGYYPMGDAEAAMAGDQLLTVADPALIKLVMKGEEVAGFVFVFPDVSRALQKAGGRLWPFGWVHLLLALKRTRRLSANGLGLLPKYQGLGANAVLYTELVKTIKQRREVEICDLAQIAETNTKSMGEMAAAGVNWYKTHRIYRRSI